MAEQDMKKERVSDEDSAQVAVQQQGDSAWPIPGDEGYVHPDGTPQSMRQIEDNKRAAADRAAAGSTVHGAPAATPGPQLADEAAAATARAEAKSPVDMAESREGVTTYVTEGLEKAAEQASDSGADTTVSAEPAQAKADATKRTAVTESGKTTR